ncbi:helix-turn-helix domain-containing protein [Brochothrix thermosphacta]|uniref:helix-turn-helix domain-containing protein n=1 Tax=Brochothrix thermosphacta TaxID=2756 RepID=UPI00265CF8A8|nr:helix-turn-helix transcriptional regulator [Brochothrix thermosphacta]WKK68962.1 helix-turn-helix transcriptional regulator [Brochothrix thermosphacta]
MNNFGEKLKMLREQNDITQEKVSKKLHVTRQSVSNWENNKNYPDLTTLVTLSQLYNISLDDLLKDENNVVKSMKTELNSYRSSELIKLIIFSVLAFLLPIIGIVFGILLLCTKKRVEYYRIAKIIGTISLIWQAVPIVLAVINYSTF